MQDYSDEYYEDKDMYRNIKRYEALKKRGVFSYFDVDDIIDIINFYIDNNKFNKAHDACKTGLSIHPTSSELKLKNAQLFVNKGQGEDALLWLNKIKEFNNSNHEYLLTKGVALTITNNITEAEQYFDKALSLVSGQEKEDIILHIAESLEQINYINLAIKYIKTGNEINPKNKEFYFKLGLYHYKTGHNEESIKYYNKYIDIYPFSENVWFNLGIVLNFEEKYSEAIEAYDYAIALDNTHYDALFNKANALANAEMYMEAIGVYNEYLSIYKNNHTALYYIGECYIQLKEYDKALKYFDRILADDKYFAEAFYGKAMVYEDLKNYEKAIKNYEKTIKIDEENTDAWFAIGNIHVKLNQLEKATTAFNKILNINKYDIEVWLLNADAYDKLGDTFQSIVLLLEAIDYLPEVSDITYSLAGYYFKQNNNRLGIHWFKNAYNTDSKNYNITFKIYPEAENIKEIQQIIKNKDI
jgi:tetratricopeptide (TPR) repeat protein